MGNVKRVFVNLTAHGLLPEQVRAIKEELGIEEIVDAEEVVPPELLKKLRQCPADPGELFKMACELREWLVEFARENNKKVYVHLPCGSPAFMWILTNVFPYAYCVPVFSHTKREVTEIQQADGSVVKKSVFRFERFIVF